MNLLDKKEEVPMNNKRFQSNKTYFTISIYALAVILIGAVIIKAIFSWNDTRAAFSKIMSILSPFLTGILIAYLLFPLIRRFYQLFHKVLHIKFKGLCKGLSIFFSYGIVIGLLFAFLFLVIPDLITSISSLINQIPGLYKSLLNTITQLEKKYPDIDLSYFSDLLDTIVPEITGTLKNLAFNILPQLYNTGVDIVKGLVNFLIAFIFSIYLLIDKDRLFAAFTRFFRIFFSEKKLDTMKVHLNKCHHILSGFIVGKIIDSAIIGVLCYIGMRLLRLDYALLISILVGITNIIPYFGPYMGAIPSALILIFISPVQCLIFVIWIVALQQLDGLLIGPKILGNSTGLRPLWIIFAISVGGSLAGILGMFFGVPILAIIFYFSEVFLTKREKLKLSVADAANTEEAVAEKKVAEAAEKTVMEAEKDS